MKYKSNFTFRINLNPGLGICGWVTCLLLGWHGPAWGASDDHVAVQSSDRGWGPLALALEKRSAHWIGQPYMPHPLGEGDEGQIDRQVRFRVDGFDCQTYVETTLAQVMAGEDGDWHKVLDILRYGGREPSYAHRLHFVSADWNPWLHELSVLEDMTPQLAVAGVKGRMVSATLAPQAWFVATQCQGNLDLCQGKQTLVSAWPDQRWVSLYVLPIQGLCDDQGNLRPTWVAALPSVSVVEWVSLEPDHWRERIGSPLLVEHMGFLFKRGDRVWFRHASTTSHQVEDIDLVDYLKRRQDDGAVIGLHVEALRAQVNFAR